MLSNFATFLVENFIFSVIFWAGPPPEKLKSKKKKKKKKGFQILGPSPYEFLDTRLNWSGPFWNWEKWTFF